MLNTGITKIVNLLLLGLIKKPNIPLLKFQYGFKPLQTYVLRKMFFLPGCKLGYFFNKNTSFE